MVRSPPHYYTLTEAFKDSPADPGWEGFETFAYRFSWRIYRRPDSPQEFRDYRLCAELDSEDLLGWVEREFGHQGGRWDFNYGYLYLYFRTLLDVTEFKLRVEVPGHD